MNTLQTAAKFAADTRGADRYMNVYAQSVVLISADIIH